MPGAKGWQVLSDGTFGCHAYGCHSRLRGNGLHKPLDSGLRRNDGREIPTFAGMTEGGPRLAPGGRGER